MSQNLFFNFTKDITTNQFLYVYITMEKKSKLLTKILYIYEIKQKRINLMISCRYVSYYWAFF